MKTKGIYILIFLGLITQSIFAQVAFKTTVSKSKLGVNQRFRIVFSINKQGADHFTPPSFKNFRVVAGPSQSVNQSWINGKVSFSQSYTYIVQPKAVGTFTIPGASITYNKKTLKSNAVKINILKAVTYRKILMTPHILHSKMYI